MKPHTSPPSLSRTKFALSSLIMQQVVRVPLTAELDICSAKNEHKTSTGVEPQRDERKKKQRSTFKLNQAEGMS